MRLLLLAVLVPTVAVAQPARDMATVCSGNPTGDDLAACGSYFLDAYNRAPAASDADGHLYNAGVMFAEAHAITGAIQSFTLLRRSFPRSKLASRALARIANLYAQVMMIDKAAEALEQFASTYAGERDAYAASSDAIYYRRALGDDDKVVQQTKYFVRTFGSKRPAEAAAATFALTAVYEKRGDHQATLAHLQDYIRQFGAKGGRDKLVIAYAKIGQLRWQQSCPVKSIDGECLRRAKRQGLPVCDGARISVERVKRDDRAVKEALAAFASAIRTYEADTAYDAVARYYARALLARIDAEAESSPMPAAPRGAKLAAWTNDRVTAGGKLNAKYERLLGVKDVATEIVAASRIARLSDDVASAIVATATKPSECKALAEAAAPFRENAIRGYTVCLTKASEGGFFEEAARGCEAALTRLAPDQFPPLRELVGAAPNTATVLVVSGP